MAKKTLKLLRVKAGMSQKALADALNVSQGAVTNWERGVSSPASDKLPKLAKALNCTIDDLYEKED